MAAVESSEAFLCFDGPSLCAARYRCFAWRRPSLPLIEQRWNSPAALQIFDKDESHLYATILAIPNYRLQATDKTVMTFAERAVGEPQAIRAWFYPGDNSGQEFFDPKEEGCGPAKITNQPVLYKPASVSRVRPSLGTIGYAEISGLAGTGGIDGPMVSRFAS